MAVGLLRGLIVVRPVTQSRSIQSAGRLVPWLAAVFAIQLSSAASVSADTVCDLRTASSCPAISGGLFFTDEVHPAGTGVINSFLRVQHNGSEQGFNTGARPVQFDEKTDPNFTRNLLLSSVSTKNIGGTMYREFFLDVNEQASKEGRYITLDQLEIFTSNTPNLNSYGGVANSGASGGLAGATKIFDLDTGGDNYVQIDYLVKSSGSGSSDMVFYLPSSLFTGQYVYLFSQFGKIDNNSNKYGSGAGFEEWFTNGTPTVNTAVPEPATLLLLGTGLAALARRRRLSRQG
jgi:hypothetical protein